jgi:hypothetical protein
MKSPRAAKMKPSFVRTFTAAAAAATSFGAIAAGCGGTTVDTACPATAPQYGSACSLRADKSCTYPVKSACGDSVEFSCGDGKWENPITCNPPPQSCPVAPPTAGSSCVYGLGQCTYTGTCGAPLAFTCGSSGKWAAASGAPVAPTCPAVKPVNGTACTADCERPATAPSCSYYDPVCGINAEVKCVDGKWLSQSPTCNPPPPAIVDAGAVDGAPGTAVDAGQAP